MMEEVHDKYNDRPNGHSFLKKHLLPILYILISVVGLVGFFILFAPFLRAWLEDLISNAIFIIIFGIVILLALAHSGAG